MHNINELIGIIKGINFDGIVNDKEVALLQSWTDKNRNLAYEPDLSGLVYLLDRVLEDHIIDDSERKQLLEYTEIYQKTHRNNIEKIYELNGIVEGIISDEEVNDSEIHRLKEWMQINGDSVRNHKSNEALCKVIDGIVDDGSISKKEQQHLFNMLSENIKESQFETKLEYLCALVKERKNIGIDIIDILDNESAITQIHRRSERQLINALSSYSGFCADKEVVVVSLTLIAMLEYDGSYYDNVRSVYTDVYRRFSEQKVEGLIRSVLNRYKDKNESGSRSRIINVVLENSIVPQEFLFSFFEFIFDIYKINFEYDLPEDPYEDFRFIYDGLKNNMLSGGDDISINVTQKTYKLIASTKKLIAKEDGLDAIIRLSIIVARLIDKRFWEKDTKVYNPYLKAGFDLWEKQLKDSTQKKHTHRNEKGEFRSRWEPKFLLDNNKVYLVPPVHKVKAQYDYRDIAIVVLNDNEEIYRESDCYIKEIIGGYQLNPANIEIRNPLGKIAYRLVVGDEIIYDSKDKLYRNLIVFNQDGKEVANNTDFEGTVYICYKPGEAKLSNIITNEYYCLGYKLIRNGGAIKIGDNIFSFSSMIKPGVFGNLHANCYISKTDSRKYIKVYKEINALYFETEKTSSGYEIIINGKPYKLSGFDVKITERDATTKYVVNLNITENGIYEITVNGLDADRKRSILNETCAVDSDLDYLFEQINTSEYRMQVDSGILDERINTLISVTDFSEDFIQFEKDGEQYCYLLPFDFGFYSIDRNAWNPNSEELWIKDISLDSEMRLYDSECDGLLVYNEDEQLTEDNIAVKDHGYYKTIAVGFLKSFMSTNKRVKLVFTADGKNKYTMFCYNKSVIDEDRSEIVFTDRSDAIIVTPIYHGKNPVYFEIINQDGEKIYTSKYLESGESEFIKDLISFENYMFNFHEKTNSMLLRKNTLIHQVSKTFYAKKDFVGKIFKINTAYFDRFINGNCVEKAYYFNKAFLRITDTIENDSFEGQIFVKTWRGEWGLDKINPVEVEICSEIIDDTIDVYMTNCGDGLLMDFEKHGILNALEHPTAPDIFLYTLGLKLED